MPAKSVAQQRLFGAIHAAQRGELKHPSAKIKSMAKHIDPTSVTHFAETRHAGLPKHVKHHKSAADVRTLIKAATVQAFRVKVASMLSKSASFRRQFWKQANDRRQLRAGPPTLGQLAVKLSTTGMGVGGGTAMAGPQPPAGVGSSGMASGTFAPGKVQWNMGSQQ